MKIVYAVKDFTKMIAWKFCFLQGIILMLSERVNARAQIAHVDDSCGFCEGGTLSNPEALIALTSPHQTHSCLEWQRTSSLSESFSDETCEFIGPFYEAICGCTSVSQIHDECHICGSSEMVFGSPLNGLIIPNSGKQHILCRTIYSGVQMGAVPSKDCQILTGIIESCGGCVAATAEAMETTDLSNAPIYEASLATASDDLAPTLAPSIEMFVSITNSLAPSFETFVAITNSQVLSSTPTTKTSKEPTIVSSSTPSSVSTTMQPSTGPMTTSSSAPSSTPTTIQPSSVPTTMRPSTSPIITSSFAPSAEPTPTRPSLSPLDILSYTPSTSTMQPSKIQDQPNVEALPKLSESETCDLCPSSGTLDRPKKLISLVNIANKTVTKTCGALLWDTRAGKHGIDKLACSYLQPFFGAICGCSTFSPFIDNTNKKKTDSSTGGDKRCKICKSSRHIFQAPYKSLLIPGSNKTQITCGGLFLGAMSGAITTSECKSLKNITKSCGGCGLENNGFYIESSPPELVPLSLPSSTPTMQPSTGPTIISLSTPSSTPTTMQPSTSPTIIFSSAPSSAQTTMQPSAHPTIISSFAPSSEPTTMQLSTSPSIISSFAPSSTPTTIQPSTSPTIISSFAPSSAPTTTQPSKIQDQPNVEALSKLSESETCDLCPSSGTLDRPKKLISLVNIANKTVTKTCGALLWDTRAGKHGIDKLACSYLQPFFGAICGCSTFSPFIDNTNEKKTDSSTGGDKSCKICKSSRHIFQAPYKSLLIPGSNKTQITCGGLFLGAMSGAITTSECKSLKNITKSCGGCGLENNSFYIDPPTKDQVKNPNAHFEPPPKQERNSSLFSEPPPLEQCIDYLDENESSMYIYKDFGSSGTTFQKAFSAPLNYNDRRMKQKQTKYPELEGCVLSPITSFDELLRAQSVIPPGKAAYTAVHKDRLMYKIEAEQCYSSNSFDDTDGVDIEFSRNELSSRISNEKCRVENWMEGLAYGYDGNDNGNGNEGTGNLSKFNTVTAVQDPCESLKSGWTNYNTGTSVPSSLWDNGQPSYCNLGSIQEVGAIWAVEADGQNYGDLRDVSMNWPLPGAVYKCCKTIRSCFEGIN